MSALKWLRHIGCLSAVIFVSLDIYTGLEITPNMTELIFNKDAFFNITCISNNYLVNWTYPQYFRNEIQYDLDACKQSSSQIINVIHPNGTYESTFQKFHACYMDTGYYSCNTTEKNGEGLVERIYIYIQDEKHPLVDVPVSIDGFDLGDVILPCRPTSPNITVGLQMGYHGQLLEVNMSYTLIKSISYNKHVGFNLTRVKKAFSGHHTCFNKADGGDRKTFDLTIDPISANITHLTLDATSAYEAVAGSEVILNCSAHYDRGDLVFMRWIFPNEGLRNLITQGDIVDTHKQFIASWLTIPKLTKAFEGEYICEAFDWTRHTEKSIAHYLVINDQRFPYLYLSVPFNQTGRTVQAGKRDFKVTVNVTSYPRASIYWRRDSDASEVSSSLNHRRFEFDGRFAKLLIDEVSIDDSGSYMIVASNGREKRELQIMLTVLDMPRINTFYDFGALYLINTNYTIENSVSGYPRPRIEWYAKKCSTNNYPKCGNEQFELLSLNSHQEYVVRHDISRTRLTISSNVTLILSLRARNIYGIANCTIKFLVTDVAGGFAVSSSPTVTTIGDDIMLTCYASKYHYNDNVTWSFNNTKLNQLSPDILSKDICFLNTSTTLSHGLMLQIRRATKKVTGLYMCHAHPINNIALTKTRSKEIYIHDVRQPSWYLTNMHHSTTKMKTEEQLTFECKVEGSPPPEIIWFKNKAPLHLLANSTRVMLRNNNQTLFFQHTAFSDEGEYTCMAVNKAGSISTSQILYFTDKLEENLNRLFLILCLVPIIICSTCTAYLAKKVHKERELRKELAKLGLLNFEKGAVESLNPELGITDQADLLPYDRQWEFPLAKLKFGKQLGSGAFGIVMKAEADGIVEENTKTTVAVKMVKRGADPLHIRALVTELKIMIHLGRHLNVVNLMGACTTDIYKCELVVIVEYCRYGNLRDFLLKQRSNFINQINKDGQLNFSITCQNRMNWSSAAFDNSGAISTSGYVISTSEETPISAEGYLVSKDSMVSNICLDYSYEGDYSHMMVDPIKTADLICWSFQIAHGMEYLSSRKVLHGDLAARNILLADDNVVKICDFGLAKNMYNNENYQRTKHELLPVRWMAIESIRDRIFSIQSDIWSFGITMWELFSLSVTPYPGIEHLETLFTKLIEGYRLEKPTYATQDIYTIMMDCWQVEPLQRPKFSQLSERLGALLEQDIRSHYKNLNKMYLDMNRKKNDDTDYLELLQPPIYLTIDEEPRYVKLPENACRTQENVVLKSLTPSTGNNQTNEDITAFSNLGYL